LTRGIALTTVYALTCYTVINIWQTTELTRGMILWRRSGAMDEWREMYASKSQRRKPCTRH